MCAILSLNITILTPNIPYPTLEVLLTRNCCYALSFVDQNQIPPHTHFGYV